jgi:copper chaperone
MACQNTTKKTEEKKQTTQQTSNSELLLKVEGMTCEGCEKTIEGNLLQLDGVSEVKACHKKQTVNLKINNNEISKNQIIEKIKDIGYTVLE